MFKIGVHGLPAAQAGLVRALVQLLSKSGNHFPWTFSNEGPYDALIVDSQSPDLRSAALREKARAVSALGSTAAETMPAELDVLEWPLKAERLESWLSRVQRTLGAPSHRFDVPDARESMPSYRLKRWPPIQLLHGDAQRIRLATLLSKRHLTVAEMARLSGQTPEQCQTLVQLMQGFGLLDLQTGEPPARPETKPRPVPSGLVQSIRRRLGL